MKHRDPVCGMQGTIPLGRYYFCSDQCISTFKKGRATPWFRERLIIVAAATLFLLLISYLIPTLRPFFDAFTDFFSLVWWAVLLGLLLGGIIEHYVPRSYVSAYLSRPGKKTLLYAVALGFLMSACSHGILAIAIELYRKGASVPAVIAFLLASPWANITVTILLISFFGVRAFALIVAALLIALVTGLVYQQLDRKHLIERSTPVRIDPHFSLLHDVKKRWKAKVWTVHSLRSDAQQVMRGSWNLARMVLWWILIGMLFASLARAFIPVHLFEHYMGATFIGILVTLALATILEICSEGTSPFAFEIFRQTGAFGNSFIFLMAGVATDYTEIGLLWNNIGKRTALWLPVITVPQILLAGYLFNILF